MIQDSIKMTGELRITVTSPDGNITQETVVPNLVVTAGKNFIASRMKDATASAMSHMAIGTGSTAAAAAICPQMVSVAVPATYLIPSAASMAVETDG